MTPGEEPAEVGHCHAAPKQRNFSCLLTKVAVSMTRISSSKQDKGLMSFFLALGVSKHQLAMLL